MAGDKIVFMIPNNLAQIDNDTAYYSAFNFPAVLKTLGPKVWQARMKPLHVMLSMDSRPKIRRSLAFSIHLIAEILGPELTTTDIMPLVFRLL